MPEIFPYDPTNWFWLVAGHEGYYSSAVRDFVAHDGADVDAFLGAGGLVTNIGSLAELKAVLGEQYPQGLPVDLPAYVAQKRWELETGGVSIGGMLVATTRESQGLIHGAYSYAKDDLIETFEFKAETGFVTLTAPQILAIGKAVAEHVQACFNWEKETLASIGSGAVSSEADVDAALSVFLAGQEV